MYSDILNVTQKTGYRFISFEILNVTLSDKQKKSVLSLANVTGTTHHFNHTLDFIISHGIDLTATDIVSQSDDVTDHILVSCMLHITDIEYKAPRYRPGRTIVPATEDSHQ